MNRLDIHSVGGVVCLGEVNGNTHISVKKASKFDRIIEIQDTKLNRSSLINTIRKIERENEILNHGYYIARPPLSKGRFFGYWKGSSDAEVINKFYEVLKLESPIQTDLKEAKELIHKGKIDEALLLLKPLVKQGHPESAFEIAEIYNLGKGGVEQDKDTSHLYYNIAIKKYKKSTINVIDSLTAVSICYEKMGQYDKAISYCERDDYFRLGTLYDLKNNPQKTAENFDKAMTKNRLKVIEYYKKKGNYSEALKYYMKMTPEEHRLNLKREEYIDLIDFLIENDENAIKQVLKQEVTEGNKKVLEITIRLIEIKIIDNIKNNDILTNGGASLNHWSESLSKLREIYEDNERFKDDWLDNKLEVLGQAFNLIDEMRATCKNTLKKDIEYTTHKYRILMFIRARADTSDFYFQQSFS